MVIKQEVAYGIVQGLSDFWKCEELQDFTVTLGATKFGCHRFLLAACSGFFRGLYRSGMKETKLKCVTVEDISSETFELILETLYTGHGVLTNDNVIDIWRAAHQLQIPFLIKECEEFAISTLSLDNYIEYYKIAKLFESKEVLEVIWSFILKNANSFFQTNLYFEMQISDVLKLIKSQDLETTSEDDVMHALLKWVEFRPRQDDDSEDSIKEQSDINSDQKGIKTGFTSSDIQHENKDMTVDSHVDNRKQHLSVLLLNTRTCLLSPNCLEMLIRHPLVRKTKKSTDIIIDALLYQLQVSKRNGHWPAEAIYRNNGNYVNSAVAIRKNVHETIIKVKAFSFSAKQWLQLPELKSKSSVAFLANDKTLYALGESITADQIGSYDRAYKKQILKLTNGNWSKVNISFTLPPEPSVVAADSFIYILSCTNQEVWQLDPATERSTRMADLPDTASIHHVTNYEQFILVFYVLADVEDTTAVDCFDIFKNTWERLEDLNGPATGMISFKDKYSTYLIQTNGNLWMVEPQSNDVEFKYLAKLWSCDWSLHGAVTFRDVLYIYGVKSETLKEDFQKQTSLEGIFSQIVYMESEDTASSPFIPLTLSRQCICQC
ncbi:kelch protein 40 [Biomphalaria glabrata]|nr:kelch protein 40 [Biomphalaria glabrata]KAI8770744.1 kelch protein 40 [Biomphalaria glabrata]KAI8770745.1 kelch protein 40 [Biomphalaria glabrata]